MGKAGQSDTVDVAFSDYIGMFLIAMSMLMLEIVLMRLFSVTLWYHFAFVAISLGLFGISVAATFVYCFSKFFSSDVIHSRLALFSAGFGSATLTGLLIHLYFPVDMKSGMFTGFATLGLNYVGLSLPFFCGGICICLLLTRFRGSVGRMYGSDLIGGAIGTLITAVLLNVTDGPGAIAGIACIGGLASVVFALRAPQLSAKIVSFSSLILLLTVLCFHLSYDEYFDSFLRIRHIKGRDAKRPDYERWNTYSRIAAYKEDSLYLGWGMSSNFHGPAGYSGYEILIDEAAGTPIVPAPTESQKLEFLEYDVTNLVHYLQPKGSIAIIGVGGGRDIRAALHFGRENVTGIEINTAIVDALKGRFYEYTGALVDDRRVNIVNDEGRSYLTRTKDSFDTIQISLIDTWAATAAGAFTLSENSLYTVEAWELFLRRLKPGGILSVSRWYFSDAPAESLRMLSLAYVALSNIGIKDPRQHILLAHNQSGPGSSFQKNGIGTVLVSPTPISEDYLRTFQEVCAKLNYEIVIGPSHSSNGLAQRLVTPASHKDAVREFSLDISAPSDNRPFFFFMLKFWDALSLRKVDQGYMTTNVDAMKILGLLLVMIGVLVYLSIILPMRQSVRSLRSLVTLHNSLFFITIGLGYLAIEIAQMQKINLFLGHPMFALVVVLFTFLISSGLGSILLSVKDLSALGRVGKILCALLQNSG